MQGHDVPDILRNVVITLGQVMQLELLPPVQVPQVISHFTQVRPPLSNQPGLHGHELLPSSYLLSVRLQLVQLELLTDVQVKQV